MVNIVGLTGGIACGKSTVVDVLREHNFAIIDCDKIAREIAKNEKVLQELLHSFGPSIIAEDGSLLRKELGRIIFQDESKRRILGSIMGKRIGYAISRSLLYHFTVGTLCVIIDAPTLYETKSLLNIVGDVVLVSTNEHIQLERLMRRDESTKEDALARIRAQMPLKVKEKHPRTSIILVCFLPLFSVSLLMLISFIYSILC